MLLAVYQVSIVSFSKIFGLVTLFSDFWRQILWLSVKVASFLTKFYRSSLHKVSKVKKPQEATYKACCFLKFDMFLRQYQTFVLGYLCIFEKKMFSVRASANFCAIFWPSTATNWSLKSNFGNCERKMMLILVP